MLSIWTWLKFDQEGLNFDQEGFLNIHGMKDILIFQSVQSTLVLY